VNAAQCRSDTTRVPGANHLALLWLRAVARVLDMAGTHLGGRQGPTRGVACCRWWGKTVGGWIRTPGTNYVTMTGVFRDA
jgi:hypothetical protein